MKHISLFALVLAVSTASAQIHFTAALSGANEVRQLRLRQPPPARSSSMRTGQS